MSDWDASDDETKATTPAVITAKPLVKKTNKWEGEDDDVDGPVVSILLNLHPPHLPKTHIPPVGSVDTLE